MHVAFFNRSFHPDTAATGQLLTELCEDLVAAHGCRVSVVAGVPLLPAAGRAAGADGHLAKPVTTQTLFAAIGAALDAGEPEVQTADVHAA